MKNESSKGALLLCSIIALGGWVGAAVSTIQQKMNADKAFRQFDVSAIQIQQLNGSVTSHALVMLTVAGLCTIPLLIAIGYAIASHGDVEVVEPPAEETATP